MHTSQTKLRVVFSAVIILCFLFQDVVPTDAKTKKVAVLQSANITPYNQAIQAFKKNLSSRLTLVGEYNLDGELTKGSDLAREIRESKVDLVLAVGLKASLVAKLEILDIPIIFCMVLNPRKFDLQAPNMSGIGLEIPFKEQLVPLQSIVPNLSRIGVLYDPNKSERLVKNANRQAKELGLELIARAVTSQKEVPTALRQMMPTIQALWVLPDSTVLTEDSFDFLLKETLDNQVPVVGFSSDLVRKGSLVATFINYDDVGEQAAGLAQSLVNGQLSTNHGIVAPKRLRTAINLNTANFLGLSVSPNALKEFDERY